MIYGVRLFVFLLVSTGLVPFFAMAVELNIGAQDTEAEPKMLDESCIYEGRVLMKPTNERISKLRLKVARPLGITLELKKNHIPATTALTEQMDDGFTYFTIMPDNGFMAIPVDGMLLDFTIQGGQAVTRISMGDQSYLQLMDGNKVYVTEEPIYLEFKPVSCVKKSDLPFLFSEVTASKVVLSVPADYPVDELVVMIGGIPYEMNDVMVSFQTGSMIVEPIVPLDKNTPIQMIVRNKKNGDELFAATHTISEKALDDAGRLAAIASRSQEERQDVIRGPIGAITLQECDILYQLEESVIEINKEQIAALRTKLNCPLDNAAAGAVAFQQVHESAGDEKGISALGIATTIGWAAFACLLVLHIAQKIRRKQREMQDHSDEHYGSHVARRGVAKDPQLHTPKKALEEVHGLKEELREAKAQLRAVYDHAKELESKLSALHHGKGNTQLQMTHDELRKTQQQLVSVYESAQLLSQEVQELKSKMAVSTNIDQAAQTQSNEQEQLQTYWWEQL